MYTYLAIGDSLTTEDSLSHQQNGLITPYLQYLKKTLKEPVCLKRLGEGTFTARKLYWYASNYQHEHLIYDASIITITAGGNDFLDAYEVAKLIQSDRPLLQAEVVTFQAMETLLRYILATKEGSRQPFCVRVLNVYNPYPHEEELDQAIQGYNKRLKTLEKSGAIQIIDAYQALQENTSMLLAIDHEQPNEQGYQKLIALLIASGLSPISES
ncbi:SGNH/GDSL hydrolase family protein [Shouchella miscanthi]|uniref:SGNH/GDSL hydrolase family protein n=1 Tax=Shouchella miscanthi TaxID=2598861 RepID=A0ABU6NK99_9BACI|nr:SGNH/GDSL hydrolase family protein [Shouchella miscanthi]